MSMPVLELSFLSLVNLYEVNQKKGTWNGDSREVEKGVAPLLRDARLGLSVSGVESECCCH